jgi:hypothetical protein
LPSDPFTYFINNRVAAFHFGYEGSVDKWNVSLKTSYSLNYETYRTLGTFGEKKQFSTYLDANRELYYNSAGLVFRVGKSF